MKKWLLFGLLTLFALALKVNCEEIKLSSWAPFSGVSNMSSVGNILSFASTSQLPLIQSKNDLFINAYSMRALRIKMKVDNSYSTARIFFKRIGDREFSYQASVDFLTGRGNSYHEYMIDIGNNQNWFGTITQLMFSPMSGKGNIEIEYIKLSERGTFSGIRSIMSDLFAFEIPQLRTVNFIYGPRIKGVSINYYIYALILIFSTLIIIAEYLKNNNARTAFMGSSKKIIILCLVFWIMLDIRTLLDQGRTVLLENEVYGGKSLEEKREAATLGGFYPFIAFCSSKITSGSTYTAVFPTYYYFAAKAAYYLYPTYGIENGDYVIVYDPDRSLANEISKYKTAGYRIYATFKEGEYILKK